MKRVANEHVQPFTEDRKNGKQKGKCPDDEARNLRPLLEQAREGSSLIGVVVGVIFGVIPKFFLPEHFDGDRDDKECIKRSWCWWLSNDG